MRPRGLPVRPLVAVAGGALAGLSLPPIGWWPMGVVGIAGIAWALRNRTLGRRLGIGMLAGIGQFAVSLAWAIQFNVAGYVALSILEAAFVAVACVLVPPGRGQLPALAGALTLAEFARESWPFGGLPLGGLVLGQVGGPLGVSARIGGCLLVMGVTALAGAGLAALVPDGKPATRRRSPLPSLVALALVVVIVVIGALAPDGASGRTTQLRVALVQGGGQRGLTQLQVPPSRVFDAAITQTANVPAGTQLILWPEDVVGLATPLQGSAAAAELAQIARAHDATLVAGVTYPVGSTQFRNEIVAFSPSGTLVATFEKVHRVPFGEYVPWRSLFKHLANLQDIPRDAIPGHGSGMIATPAGRFGVLVSYEVFFADRGRSGVRAGGAAILVPTNTSSYSNGQAPAQEIAASRLQAVEEGRYVLQAAPTGYTAVIDNHGDVRARTSLSVAATVSARIPLLSGDTWYERAGDLPVVLAALALVAGGWAAALSALSGQGQGPDQGQGGSLSPAPTSALSPASRRRRRGTSPSR